MSDLSLEAHGRPVATAVDRNALASDIRQAIINDKANACPMIVRLAWHASGTFNAADNTGGSNGATMRFAPESADNANAGLSIARDLLLPVVKAHPKVSIADIWTYAGCLAIEFLGGPKIPFNFGRTDAKDGKACPAVGRLPDAAQGAQHLRDVFYRMGFDDRAIVALSGAHTLGRCHPSRSGFDGPWSRSPLVFNHFYFKHLLEMDWQPRKWEGPLQYEAEIEGWKLMMLPTDLCLRDDPKFKVWVEIYAANEQAWFADFSAAFARLISLNCPASAQPDFKHPAPAGAAKDNAHFRELCMHGSAKEAKELAKKKGVDTTEVEASSGRTALHKAAFWGHDHLTSFLVDECKIDVNKQDNKGDTALHDAARFGHVSVVQQLLKAGADKSIKNKQGKTAGQLAVDYDKREVTKQLA